MDKDFDEWNGLKKRLDKKTGRKLFKPREIWWCHIGKNIRDEENGKGKEYSRPVLIIKKFNNNLFIALPLSTSLKNKFYYHKFNFKGRQQSVILSQIRMLDSKRLAERMGTITDAQFDLIKEKAMKLVF